jgi:hypothetical protein
MRRAAIGGIVVLIAVGVGVAFAQTRHGGNGVDCRTYRFDAKAWRTWKGHPSPHERQGRALVQCQALQGRSRAEVRKLLGPPDDRDRAGIAYELGPDALGIDAIFLDVRLVHGEVKRLSLYQG